MKAVTAVSMEKSTLKAIDIARGNVPRSRILEDLINRGISTPARGVSGNDD
jgi:hypothetical protein